MVKIGNNIVNWKNVRLFVFDLDGTLIDTSDRFYKVFSFLSRKYGLPEFGREEFHRLYSENRLDEKIVLVKQRFLPEFLRIYSDFKGDGEHVYPGVKETLSFLKERGYKIAVVTGRITEEETVRAELQQHGIGHLIDDSVTNNLMVDEKEDLYLVKSPYLKRLMEKYNAKPHECVVVGDYITDIASGKSLGCVTIAVLTGGTAPSLLEKEKPDFMLRSVSEIVKFIQV